MEQIVCLQCLLSNALDPEDQIDPPVQLFTDISTLQGLPHPKDELFASARLDPARQQHIVDPLLVLLLSQIDLIPVLEEVAQVVELWNELLDILL